MIGAKLTPRSGKTTLPRVDLAKTNAHLSTPETQELCLDKRSELLVDVP